MPAGRTADRGAAVRRARRAAGAARLSRDGYLPARPLGACRDTAGLRHGRRGGISRRAQRAAAGQGRHLVRGQTHRPHRPGAARRQPVPRRHAGILRSDGTHAVAGAELRAAHRHALPASLQGGGDRPRAGARRAVRADAVVHEPGGRPALRTLPASAASGCKRSRRRASRTRRPTRSGRPTRRPASERRVALGFSTSKRGAAPYDVPTRIDPSSVRTRSTNPPPPPIARRSASAPRSGFPPKRSSTRMRPSSVARSCRV